MPDAPKSTVLGQFTPTRQNKSHTWHDVFGCYGNLQEAGVAPEVNLSIHAQVMNHKVIRPGYETQGWRHQKYKTRS